MMAGSASVPAQSVHCSTRDPSSPAGIRGAPALPAMCRLIARLSNSVRLPSCSAGTFPFGFTAATAAFRSGPKATGITS